MAKPKFFRKVFTGDRNFDTLQTNIEAAVGEVLKSPILDGRLIRDIVLATGNNRIEHKMDRELLGYMIVKRNNASAIYDVVDSEPAEFLQLNSAGSVTVSLWVF